MEKNFVSPAQDHYEYLLVVHPSEHAYAQLMEEKKYFFDTYNEKAAIKTLPHITITHFLAREEMEDTIIRYMRRILAAQESFTITLNNFSGFPPHTVYTRVQDHEPFKQMAVALKPVDAYVCGNGCPPAKFSKHPHVTVARRLKPDVYEKAMFDFSQRSFYTSFNAGELILLKRQHQFDTCRQVNVFKLLPHP